MKHFLILGIALFFVGIPHIFAQDSLFARDPLWERVKRYIPSYQAIGNSNETDKKIKSPINKGIVYDIPVSSKGNSIKLAIANNTNNDFKELKVKVSSIPFWINMPIQERTMKLVSGDRRDVIFMFDIKPHAPIGTKADLILSASDGMNYNLEKQITLRVKAPTKFKLLPNYPNPFNPTTTIRYRLPTQMNVLVTVYNILGRKIATLADGIQQAGQHELRWNASNMASGIYFYRIIAEGQNGKQVIQQKKMMLIK